MMDIKNSVDQWIEGVSGGKKKKLLERCSNKEWKQWLRME